MPEILVVGDARFCHLVKIEKNLQWLEKITFIHSRVPHHVIEKVFAHARKFDVRLDAMPFEISSIANTRSHQDQRRAIDTGSENHLFVSLDRGALAIGITKLNASRSETPRGPPL